MVDSPGAQPKDPLEDLLDLAVFAPIGLVLHCMENYDDLVERGRRQLRFAQSVGQMALGALSRDAGTGSPPNGRAQSSADDGTRGSAGDGNGQRPASDSTAAATKKAAAPKAMKPKSSPPKKSGKTAAKPRAKSKSSAKKTSGSTARRSSRAVAPFDVTTMRAKDAIPAIGKLKTEAQLAAVASAEKSGANRVTVLRAVAARKEKVA